jgi:hypothetical protein
VAADVSMSYFYLYIPSSWDHTLPTNYEEICSLNGNIPQKKIVGNPN